jgi:hypothetical protein
MDNIYEDVHLHLGYYQEGHDLEAIAFKRKGIHTWDIYFDSDQYNLPIDKGSNYTPYFGYKILVVHSQELTYEEGSLKFEKWLRENSII